MFALAMVVSATVLSSCDTFANLDNGTSRNVSASRLPMPMRKI